MGFFSKLFRGSRGETAEGNDDPSGFHVYVRCDRCGEAIHIRANRATDIGEEYDGETSAKMFHKEILGSKCQNLMYIHLTLDQAFRVVESSTERCTLISREDYEAAQQPADEA